MSITQLQEYVDPLRASHYLEGEFGEYILPNSAVFGRESRLYADLIAFEEGEPIWSNPEAETLDSFLRSEAPWELCQALAGVGAFTRLGLDIVAQIWEKQVFEGEAHPDMARHLTREMLLTLEAKGLVSEDVDDGGISRIYNNWQMPMYLIEFKPVRVDLEAI